MATHCPHNRLLPHVQILQQSPIPPINVQLFHYLKHLNPIHSVERFLEINKTDIHFIPTFQTSLTQCPHYSNCISCSTTFPEPKLIPSQQMFCFRLYSLCQQF